MLAFARELALVTVGQMKIRILALAWLGTASLLVLSSIIYPSNTLQAQRGALTWVSASRRNLYEAFEARGLTSRFLNDALKLSVGPLSNAAAVELAQRAPNAELAMRMVETAGGFAYGLQWLGDFVCRRSGQIEAACDAFADDVTSTFQTWWASLDVHERQLVKRCLQGGVTVAELDARSRRLAGLQRRRADQIHAHGCGTPGRLLEQPPEQRIPHHHHRPHDGRAIFQQ
jgi:hypothetical protein